MFKVATKGSRPSDTKVYISSIARTINFSAGFFRTFNIDINLTKYIRLAYDTDTKEIAIEFSDIKRNDNEYLRMTLTQSKTSASSSINPILATFSIGINEISGTYKGEALIGPVKINSFTDKGFILKVKLREV
jgi:hypothetical protein